MSDTYIKTSLNLPEKDHKEIMEFCKTHGYVFTTITIKLWKEFVKKEIKRLKKSA
jgi:hypothetical protein